LDDGVGGVLFGGRVVFVFVFVPLCGGEATARLRQGARREARRDDAACDDRCLSDDFDDDDNDDGMDGIILRNEMRQEVLMPNK